MKEHPSSHDRLLNALARVIRERRRALRLSQREIAQKSNLNRSYVSDFEQGLRNLSVKNLLRLADALNTTPSSLIEEAERQLVTVDSDNGRTQMLTRTADALEAAEV